MKESIFEMLLTLFETTLLRLKEASAVEVNQPDPLEKKGLTVKTEKKSEDAAHLLVLKEARPQSSRVFMFEEQMKLSKSSQQFLLRMMALGVISSQLLELVIHRLLISESETVSLQETKWTIRSMLADRLSVTQLAYLDLVLYDKEDGIVHH